MSDGNSFGPDGHSHKRLRVGQEGQGLPMEMSGEGDSALLHKGDRRDEFRMDPSPVVHVRALHRDIIEADIWDSLSVWGKITNIFMMSTKHQALVEFEREESARNLVYTAQNQVVNIRSYPTLFNFSKSKKIDPIRNNETDQRRAGGGVQGEIKEHHIVLFTIRKPMYPITVDVMHTICKPHGRVLRIVIFRKSVLQSMVEFEDSKAAAAALRELNGQDIYSGCCTIKAEYAKQVTLNVSRNDTETWDFTMDARQRAPEPQRSKPLLAEPSSGPPRLYNETYVGDNFICGPSNYDNARSGRESYDRRGYQEPQMNHGYGNSFVPQGAYGGSTNAMGAHPPRGPPQGAVLIFHGLNPEKMNCDRLFNLLCLYGNVERIKFLKTKEGAAMAQMGDPVACERVINNLHGAMVFDSRMQVSFSKQVYLEDQNNPGDLKDGTCAFKDFKKSKNNRFVTPTQAAKNRIQPPTELVHFYNAPPGLIEEEILHIIENESGIRPESCKIFPLRGESKSTSGLLRFNAKKDAADAVASSNHSFVIVPEKPTKDDGQPNGHIFKLCFSNARE